MPTEFNPGENFVTRVNVASGVSAAYRHSDSWLST